jgi:predicted nucleic acid-binding protein
MTSYLLDTNHAVKVMAGEEPVSSQLAGQSQEGDWFYIIPGTDAQIAAVARLHGLTVLTADRHFHFVDGVTTANWLEGENGNVDSARANVG